MIQMSDAAVREVKRLRLKQVSSSMGRLRIRVEQSGCSGLSYQLSFDNEQSPGDRIFDCDDLDVIIDPSSLEYIGGLEIDYTEDLMGGAFRFFNPNAIESCNCGHSFAIDESIPRPSLAAMI